MDVASIITAVAMIVLAILTGYYAYHTKKLVEEAKIARRDDPELKVYIHDPPEHEWRKDISRIASSSMPTSAYLRLKVILVNPGAVPIVITDARETLEDTKGEVVTSTGKFVIPSIRSLERYGFYVFCLPWVIVHDDFSIWYRTFELTGSEGERYLAKLMFNYEVGEKQKSVTKEIQLSMHEEPTKVPT